MFSYGYTSVSRMFAAGAIGAAMGIAVPWGYLAYNNTVYIQQFFNRLRVFSFLYKFRRLNFFWFIVVACAIMLFFRDNIDLVCFSMVL